MQWRPVLAGKASYYEVAHQWTFNELIDCLEILDIQEALEKELRDKKIR